MKKTPRDVGTSLGSGVTQVSDLMTHEVLTVQRHEPLDKVRHLMATHGVHSVPVVGGDGEAVGIVTSLDLVREHAEGTRVGQVMTDDVLTIPQYSGIHQAARMMRNHRVHHLVVTHEKRVVGLLSSFDLLRLVENKRFTTKAGPAQTRKRGKRARQELSTGDPLL